MIQSQEHVTAFQWLKNGDHPLDYVEDEQGLEKGELRTFTGAERQAKGWEGGVVRYFRHPEVSGDTICPSCGKTMHEHGWLDSHAADKSKPNVVCPGGWVVQDERGLHALTQDEFTTALRPVLGLN